AIFNNKPKEKKQYCGKCESGDITVAKLENIPRGIEKAPILYLNGRMICPFCQGKSVFLNYIRKAVDNQRMPQVIAYLDVKEQLETFLPVIREVISQADFEHYYKQSRALWAGQISPKAIELIRRAFCHY
ncbi:MAG: hypothetical protein KA886_11035, partial [Candidatus Cloacimonetes bacterium]|nr:hypothetical protein [Candidatus Cloacimonadota bacterium]